MCSLHCLDTIYRPRSPIYIYIHIYINTYAHGVVSSIYTRQIATLLCCFVRHINSRYPTKPHSILSGFTWTLQTCKLQNVGTCINKPCWDLTESHAYKCGGMFLAASSISLSRSRFHPHSFHALLDLLHLGMPQNEGCTTSSGKYVFIPHVYNPKPIEIHKSTQPE